MHKVGPDKVVGLATKDKIRVKSDRIKIKREARKRPDSSQTKSKPGILGDKIICDLDKTPDLSQRSPQNYPKCGNLVDGHYCQGCARLRKKFKEDTFTSYIENGILQDSSEPSNDNTNVANAPREPFVGNEDPKKIPHKILHKSTTIDVTIVQFTVNHPIFDTKNNLFDSQNMLVEQLTSMCDMVGQFIQKKEEEKQIEKDQAANTRYWKIPAFYDDGDDDYTFAITPIEPDNSLSMGDEHFDTVLATESDEFIKFSVENLIDSLFDVFADELTLRKSISPGIDETNCDPEEETRFIKRLLYDNSSPRPPKEFVYANSDTEIESFSPSPILVEDSDSLMEEINLSFTSDYPMPPGIEEDDYDSKRDILILEELLSNDSLSIISF
nr:hypothetical protein [Tanacetum cinerariifolium]